MGTEKKIAVVHLVWQPLPVEHFMRFLYSYRQHPAGAPHDLIVVFAFPGEVRTPMGDHTQYLNECFALLDGVPHSKYFVSNAGLDLHTYGLCVRNLPQTHFCFLNSYTEILADGWLAKLDAALCGNIGVVGAMGSLEYSPTRSTQFPNPHLRTHGFLIAADLMRQIWPASVKTKDEAFEFESGKLGMTRAIQKLGMRVALVGKNGQIYDIPDWPRSQTFRLGNQQNLLMGDNHTAYYASASPDERRRLTETSWGSQAI